MRSKLNGITVDDQAKALRFYTEVLGFVPKEDIPMGEFRWLTVIAADGSGAEVVLEPNANPVAKTFQAALLEQGIPATAFEVDDLDAEFARLSALGVVFDKEPMDAGPTRIATLSDTCGNLIQLYEVPKG